MVCMHLTILKQQIHTRIKLYQHVKRREGKYLVIHYNNLFYRLLNLYYDLFRKYIIPIKDHEHYFFLTLRGYKISNLGRHLTRFFKDNSNYHITTTIIR